MGAGMNGFDYALIALIGLGALYGLGRGALRMFTSVLALIIAVYLASSYYLGLGAWLRRSFMLGATTAAVLGYLLVFVAALVAVEFAGQRAINLSRMIHLGWLDSLGGVVLGAAIGAVVAGLAVVMLTAALPPRAGMLRDSQLAPRLVAYNHALLGFIPPHLEEVYESKRGELLEYWARAIKNPDSSSAK
ncbi:MAG: CvpA family protein [Candidatus Binataceae bacterium]